MNKSRLVVFSSLILALAFLAASCSVPAAGGVEDQVMEEEIVIPETPAEEAPAEEPAAPEPESEDELAAYTAPNDVFTLDVPSAWDMDRDETLIEKTVFETFTSPDGNAFVQVLVNDVGQGLNQVLKRDVTTDYMRRLYGEDLRISTDVALEDGRERLEWRSEASGFSGTTYFDQVPGFLFFYTVASRDDFKEDYAEILAEVDNSFAL